MTQQSPCPARPRPSVTPHFPGRHAWLKRLIYAVAHRLAPMVRRSGWSREFYRWFLRRPSFPHRIVEIEGLPESLSGFRIAHVSDLHGGLSTDSKALEPWFELLEEHRPDLVAITGDFVCFDHRDLPHILDSLGRLSAPHGVFSIFGNHDYYGGDEELIQADLESRGLKVLRNQGLRITRGGDSFWLSGVEDLEMGTPCFASALKGKDPKEISIGLSHHPDSVSLAPDHGIDLLLSGHTHGGQIRFPGIGALVKGTEHHWVEGTHRHRSTQMHISRGLGAVLIPVRLFCAPEIPILELRKASSDIIARGSSS